MRTNRSYAHPTRATRAAIAAAILALTLSACERVPASGPGGSALLTWTPVSKDVSGHQLKDLAGYKVFYGTSPRALYTVVVLPNPGVTQYTVTDLAPGTWYFAVAAYTTGNVEGVQSNVASKMIH
jgi:hypothetical protein